MHDKGAVEIAAKIMVVCIILLLLVVLFVIFLHLCAEWFLRRNNEEPPQPIPRHSRSLHGHNVVYLDLNPGEESMQMGLDPAVLRSIPIVIFEAKDFEDGLACAVCLSEVEPGEKARLLPYCNHGFHVDCIEMWLQSHSTCPLCRKSVAPQNVQSSGESSASFGYSSFPTNALFWGDETQVSINGYNNGGCSEDETSTTRSPPSSSSSSSSSSSASPQLAPQSSSLASSSSTDARQEQILAIDVPLQSSNGIAENESRSPTVTRWRSLKRLLMGKKRVPPNSSSNCVRV